MLLQIDRLSKKFNSVLALDQVSLTLEKGKIYGLIGPNGAGKSTLMRIIAGIYRQDEGELSFYPQVDPTEPGTQAQKIYDQPASKQHIRLVADQPYFPYPDLEKTAKFQSSMYLNWDWSYYKYLLTQFSLDEKQTISSMSKGQKAQINLVLALASRPLLLLLDESFDGLDPMARHILVRLLQDEVEDRSLTVFLASHNLDETETFCKNFFYIHQGHLSKLDLLNQTKAKPTRVQLVLAEQANPVNWQELFPELLEVKGEGQVQQLLLNLDQDECQKRLEGLDLLVCDFLPLTLSDSFAYLLNDRTLEGAQPGLEGLDDTQAEEEEAAKS